MIRLVVFIFLSASLWHILTLKVERLKPKDKLSWKQGIKRNRYELFLKLKMVVLLRITYLPITETIKRLIC